MTKVTLSHVGAISSTTDTTTINTDLDLISTAFDNTLSLNGATPNQMTANLDMNSNHLLNLPAPVSLNEPLRLTDANTLISGGTISFHSIPTGGSTNAVLAKNSGSDYDTLWTNSPTFTAPALGNPTATTVVNAVGSAALPSYTFSGRTGDGMYSSASGTLAFSVGGVQIGTFAANSIVLTGSGTNSNVFDIVCKSTTGGNRSSFQCYRDRSGGAIQSGDVVGSVDFFSHDGTQYLGAASILANCDNTVSAGVVPTSITLSTGTSNTPTVRLTISSAGLSTFSNTTDATSASNASVIMSGGLAVAKTIIAGSGIFSANVSGIGYTTGAGGTVTQGTSRTTAVTLNKICGQITMFSAAGSATAAQFTVNNSAVVSTDTIILNCQSATNKYLLHVSAVGAGSFEITFQTTTGTSTDAPVINFTVLKGVAS